MEWLCILGHLTIAIFVHLTDPGVQGQSCLESSSEKETPSTRSQYKHSILPAAGGHQAIIPGYRFNCSGSIREWTVEVTQIDEYNLNLQVWRPSDSSTREDDTQRYVLIGQNSIIFCKKFSCKNSTELEVIKVMISPLPEDQVHFEPGDVLGVYVSSYWPKGSGIALLSSEQGDSSLKEEVWYAMVDKQETAAVDGQDCPQTTTLDTFINAVPAISVSVNIATNNDPAMPATAIDYCSQYIILSRNRDNVNSPPVFTNSAHTGLIIGAVSAAISFMLCIVTVLHKIIKRKRKTNAAPITVTTDPGMTTPARANVRYGGNAGQEYREINAPIGFTTAMRDNVCYGTTNIVQNQEIDGSYPYSYPYFSSVLTADVRGRPGNDHSLQGHQGVITVAANGETAGENVTMKQRSCENEEDIYSYII